MLELLKKALPWFLAGLLVTVGYSVGSERMEAKWQKEVQNEYVKKADANRLLQVSLSNISDRYQADLASVKADAARTVDDVHRDNKRLRVKLKETGTSGSQCGREPDGKAELDDQFAGSIIEVTQKGDAWIQALQDTIRALQGKLKKYEQEGK